TRPGQPTDAILVGRTPADVPDPGPVLCSCFGVGVNTIARAIEERGLASVDQIGAALRAGTNCGSCRPELADLLTSLRAPKAAE
ncbi:MAG: (2Fe-2S)-binding protein, partial [Pseudomonadota bacterium]